MGCHGDEAAGVGSVSSSASSSFKTVGFLVPGLVRGLPDNYLYTKIYLKPLILMSYFFAGGWSPGQKRQPESESEVEDKTDSADMIEPVVSAAPHDRKDADQVGV